MCCLSVAVVGGLDGERGIERGRSARELEKRIVRPIVSSLLDSLREEASEW